jgi:uncharacterized protein
MTIAYEMFTPAASLAGGLLIGAACALYVLGNGKIAGIAGIIAGPLRTAITQSRLTGESARLLFLAGLLLAPWVWQLAAPMPNTTTDVGMGALILAGLLVGVGVRMGNGCTSGHGVCGLSRFSKRSFVNVMSFMGAGMVTVFVVRHLI